MDQTDRTPNLLNRLIPAGWRPALRLGVPVALAHRVLLGAWTALVWWWADRQFPGAAHAAAAHPELGLPAVNEPLISQLLLGTWRRWDVGYFLSLARNGYGATDIRATYYTPLTPLGIRLVDVVVPGPIDSAGVVYGLLVSMAIFVLLYRLVEITINADVARWSVILLAVTPLSYFYAAAMADGLFLALTLGMFIAAQGRRWPLAALLALLASLARAQGIALMGVLGVMLLFEDETVMAARWPGRLWVAFKRGWTAVLVPLGFTGFLLYRGWMGFPSIPEVLDAYWLTENVDPVTSIYLNTRSLLRDPLAHLVWAEPYYVLATLALLVGLFMERETRRPGWLVYALGYTLTFLTIISPIEINGVEYVVSVSFPRYTLVLFPVTVLFALWAERGPGWRRLMLVTLGVLGLLAYSAMFAIGRGPF